MDSKQLHNLLLMSNVYKGTRLLSKRGRHSLIELLDISHWSYYGCNDLGVCWYACRGYSKYCYYRDDKLDYI